MYFNNLPLLGHVLYVIPALLGLHIIQWVPLNIIPPNRIIHYINYHRGSKTKKHFPLLSVLKH